MKKFLNNFFNIVNYIFTFGYSKKLDEKIQAWEDKYIPMYFKEMEKQGIHYCASGDPRNITRDLKIQIYKYYNAPWYMY